MSTAVQQQQIPLSESQRQLQGLKFEENSILSRDLPRDTVLKAIQLRLSGAVQTTYGSGTPLSDSFSTFDNIIPRIDVIINGSRVVKSVRPFAMRMQQLFTTVSIAERRASAAASALNPPFPTVDGGFVYGSTTQYTTVAESILLSFEMVYAAEGLGREATWLNTKGVASAELKLTTTSFAKLLAFGNTAPVAFGNSTLYIDITCIEARFPPANLVTSDWKQTTKELTFSAETTDFPIDINRGNKLTGIMLIVRNGQAGSSTTATGRLPSNTALTKIAMKLNGQADIKATTFQLLQAENRARYGINAPMSSNVSLIDGVAHLNFLTRKTLTTALDLRPPQVDNAQLFVDTAPSGAGADYTNPVSVTVMTEELVEPR